MNPTPGPSLLPIIAYARSGALDHAWRMFREAGLESVTDDPAVLSVRGRLLKDRARAAREGAERRRLFQEAAEAYARAGAVRGGTYPLINAASLSLLAGRRDASARLAQEVLDRLADGPGEPETPYYREATRAEALLLLGRTAEARAALARAMALAPRAWEDHASTLRQFGLILAALRQDAAWLDELRPPRALHFAGHMALPADAPETRAKVDAVLASEQIGFGYGAPAAGADLLIAEALLDAGAELHLVLPGSPEAFCAASVEGSGADWTARFDAVLARADTVRTIRDAPSPPHPLGIRLAAEIAMGQAALQAQALTTEAVQLLILDPREAFGEEAESARIGRAWIGADRRQRVVTARRTRARPDRRRLDPAAAEGQLAAMVQLDAGRPLGPELVSGLGEALREGTAPLATAWSGRGLSLVFDLPAQASAAAVTLRRLLEDGPPARIGAHYGVVGLSTDPFGSGLVVTGAAAEVPAAVAAAAPPGAIHVTGDFCAALHARGLGRFRTEYVGELPGQDIEAPVQLHSLGA